MNDNYTKREQDEYRREVLETLSRIEKQVCMTNGRVDALENWRWGIAGGLAVITFILPFLILMNNKLIDNLSNKVDENRQLILTTIPQNMSKP